MSMQRIIGNLYVVFIIMFAFSGTTYGEEGSLLFSESFEKINGQVQGKTEVVKGKVDNAVRLHGPSAITYSPAQGKIDLGGGEISFWVSLNFDPMKKNEKTKNQLRNQTFFTLWDPSHGRSRVCFYNAGRDILAISVVNADGNIAFYINFQQVWKPFEWHQVSIRWGQQIELWCDGEKKASSSWNGLLGSVPMDLEKSRILVGTQIGYADVDSEFTMDELQIRGPGSDQLGNRPRIMIPLLSDEPNLDGKLTDPFWERAARISGFVGLEKNDLAAGRPVVYVAYTSKGLYFGLDRKLPAGMSPRAVLSQHDSAIYQEDAIEMYMQPKGMNDGFYQFIGSAIGTQYDMRSDGKKADVGGYNPEWQMKTHMESNQWSAEVFIPFAAINDGKMPEAGDIWRGNICVDSSNGFSNAAVWSFSMGNFQQTTHFGDFLFAGKERTLRQVVFDGFTRGDPQITMNLVGDFQPIITMRSEMGDSSGKNIFKNDMLIRDTKSVTIKPSSLTSGTYTMLLSGVDETGKTVFSQNFGFKVDKAFNLALENYPYAGYVLVQTDVRGVKGQLAKVAVTFLDAKKAEAGKIELTEFKNGQSEGRYPNEKLTSGVYQVKAEAISPNGKVLESVAQTLEIFAKPAWWKNTYGIDHSVPPPFQPVKVLPDRLSVWGRDYVFEKSVFLQQIKNQNKMMFSQPTVFTLDVNGQSVDLAAMDGKVDNVFPDVVTRISRKDVGSVSVQAKTTVEFDGFLRYDLTLTPASPAKVEKMSLGISLPKEIAHFLMTSNGTSSNIAILDKKFESSFLPYLWIGNDEGGLAWFSESDQYWNPKDGHMLQIIPGEKDVTLKINFVTTSYVIQKPITLSFGLMATPVKSVDWKNPFLYPSYGDKGQAIWPESLTYPLENNINPDQGTLEFFVKRSCLKNQGNTQIFHVLGGKKTLSCTLLTPDKPDMIKLIVDNKSVLTANIPLGTETFDHLAFTWKGNSLSIYVDGKRIKTVTGKMLNDFKDALTAEKDKIHFGCKTDRSDYTAIILDEIRISKTIRYHEDFTLPQEPFTKDADTLLLDHLDDTFKPDGQDAETSAGGLPTIGCRFVPAKFNNGLKLEVADPRPCLDVMKEMGVNIFTHWLWTPEMVQCYGQPYMSSPIVPGLKEEIAKYHQKKIPIIPYMAFPAITNTSGLIPRYGDEWCVKPISTMPWMLKGSPEGYYFLICCLKSQSYQDYFAAYLAWAMDDLGFDGFYSDGTTQVSPCQNTAHGCGYTDENGNRHSTWPIFAVRENTKRMYRIVKGRNPNGFVANHASFNLIIPVLSFSDVVYTGEHEDYENLLTARIRFCSRPWGTYVTVLGSSEHAFSSLHAMTPLLNGTSVWGEGILGRNDIGRKDWAIRKVYQSFNVETANWVPYYEGENKFYTVADPKVKVSLYDHKGKDILLLATNYNAEKKKAFNTLTDQKIDILDDGTMTLVIKPKSFVLIKVESYKSMDK
jgi:hypothetical protein